VFPNNPLLPIPPTALIGRVIGSQDTELFASSGRTTITEWARALALVDRTFSSFSRIVDFGCGCGRTIRHLRPILHSSQELVGLDVDGEAISWLVENYPLVIGHKLDLYPPCALGSGSIDLVLNQSVFTHLPEDAQFAWLQELHRIARSDALLLLSFHGQSVWQDFRAALLAQARVDDATQLDRDYQSKGFVYMRGRSDLEQALPDYYGSTLHSIEYVTREWSRWFVIVAWLPRFSLQHQDVIVLRKR
jgi:SAM-dependent methyltransferase